MTADRERPDDSLETTHLAGGAPEDRAPARVWGDLQIRSELGRGAFGRVYHAWDPALSRDVALKIIRVPGPGQGATVLREGRLLARVRHRNVVVVHSARLIGDEVGLTMELVRGRHLSDLVRHHGPMGAEEATVVGLSVCSALAAVHAAGLVHRDVKARNVMRESGGRIVLMDFGAGLDASSRAGRIEGGGLTGTPLYMAPELFTGAPASPASDLYSVGVLLFFLVTRDMPVTGGSLEHVSAAHASHGRRLLSDLRPDLPPGFVRVVDRVLDPEPGRRHRTAGELAADLAAAGPAVTSGESLTWPADASGSLPGGLGEPPLWRRLLSANAMAACVAALVVLWGLGLLTSMAHDSTLRIGEYSRDTPWTWLGLGLLMIIPFVVPALLVLVTLYAMRAAWQVLPAVVPGAGALAARLRVGLRRVGDRAAARSDASAAQWLLLAQVLALAALGWLFRDVIGAYASFADVTDPETMALLGGPRPNVYRLTLTIAIALMAVAWHAILTRPGLRARAERPMIVGGAAIMLVLLVMLELPYRLLYHPERPVVAVRDQCCFELGRHAAGSVLVYCPEAEVPRIREADAGEVRAQTVSATSIFWTLGTSEADGELACQPQPR